MRIGPWINLVLVVLGAAFLGRQEWLRAIACLLGALFVTRWAFPTPPVVASPPPEGERPRVRWGLLLVGVTAGYFGTRFWSTSLNWIEGWYLQVPAFFCIVYAFPRWSPLATPVPDSGRAVVPETGTIIGSARGFLIPAVLTALMVSASIHFFQHGRNVQLGIACVLAALATAFLLAWRRRGTSGPSAPAPDRQWLWIVLGFAALLRFPFIGQDFSGLQIDEANHLLDGVGVMTGQLKNPFWTGWWANPAFVYYWYAAFFDLFGVSLPSGRALSAILSMFSLFVFFKLARLYVGRSAALLATLMFSFAWYHLYYSLSPFTNIFTVLFELCTFYFLEKGFREGRRSDFVWAGLWMAASVMSYISGRLVVGMVGLSIAGRVIFARGPFLRTYGRHLLLTALAFLWLLGPFLHFIALYPLEFFGRSDELSILNEVKRLNDPMLPVRTFGQTLLTFFRNANPDPRFGLFDVPVVDAVSAVLLVLGFAFTVTRFRSWFTWVVVPGFLMGVFANSFAIQCQDHIVEYLNQQRFYLILPFVFLMVARGWGWLLENVRGGRDGRRKPLTWALAAVLLFSAAWNARVYYHDISRQSTTWDSMGFSHQEISRLYEELHPTHHLVVQWELFSSIMQFLLRDRVTTLIMDDAFRAPLTRAARRDVAFFFIPYRDFNWQDNVRSAYPGAEWKDYTNYFGGVYLRAAFVKREEYEKARQGLPAGAELP